MSTSRTALFTPVRIGKMEIKTLSVPPMLTGIADSGGFVSERLINYIAAGAGRIRLITVRSRSRRRDRTGKRTELRRTKMGAYPDTEVGRRCAHSCGAKLAVSAPPRPGHICPFHRWQNAVAPSAVPDPIMREMPHALTVDEIAALVESSLSAARRVKDAGCDRM